MSHTPGPWEVLGPYPSIHVGILVDAGCGGEYPEPPRYEPLCQVYLDPLFKREASDETKANAHLMAASPDMFDVLKAYEQWEADLILCNEAWNASLPCMTQELYDRFIEIQSLRNAAVAKAKGEL